MGVPVLSFPFLVCLPALGPGLLAQGVRMTRLGVECVLSGTHLRGKGLGNAANLSKTLPRAMHKHNTQRHTHTTFPDPGRTWLGAEVGFKAWTLTSVFSPHLGMKRR